MANHFTSPRYGYNPEIASEWYTDINSATIRSLPRLVRSYATPDYKTSAQLKPPNPIKTVVFTGLLNPKIKPSKPYFVQRTKSQNLPVYSLAKSGGTKKLTQIRKITGDILVLRQELKDHLGLKEDDIAINHLTQQVLVKGWKRADVCEYLRNQYF